MKLLVISDLHVGPSARAKDYSTDPEGMACRNTPDYYQDFAELVQRESLEATHLIIAGDITQSAKYEEFEKAAENIAKLAKLLNVDQRKIFFTPGNHDGCWESEKQARKQSKPESIVIRQKYFNIDNTPFFKKIHTFAEVQNLYTNPFFSIWATEDILVASVNSAARDGTEDQIHHGSVTTEDLIELQDRLSQTDSDGKLRVLLTHHHPKNYVDNTFPENDFSIMKNAEAFLKFATKNEFDIIIHGHKHIPRFNIHSDAYNSPVVTLSAGSFSASLKDYHNGVGNFFHIIEIEGKCAENQNIQGKVSSWTYFENTKWRKADLERDFICFTEYFGDTRNKKRLKTEFKNVIQRQLSGNQYFRWSDHLANNPSLKYCNTLLRREAVEEVCRDENWEFIPMDVEEDFLVIIPKGDS